MSASKVKEQSKAKEQVSRAFSRAQASSDAWQACAENAALLIDALSNVRTQRRRPAAQRVDQSGLALLGPVCSFAGRQSAVERGQVAQYERLLTSISQSL